MRKLRCRDLHQFTLLIRDTTRVEVQSFGSWLSSLSPWPSLMETGHLFTPFRWSSLDPLKCHSVFLGVLLELHRWRYFLPFWLYCWYNCRWRWMFFGLYGSTMICWKVRKQWPTMTSRCYSWFPTERPKSITLYVSDPEVHVLPVCTPMALTALTRVHPQQWGSPIPRRPWCCLPTRTHYWGASRLTLTFA